MSFYSRFKSRPFNVVLRHPETDILVGRPLVVMIDFRCEMLNENGLLVPGEALGRLEDICAELFDDKLLIDQKDPYADHLMNLKRIKAIDPQLFDYGTSGPQLAFALGRKVEEWLEREKWNQHGKDDLALVMLIYAEIELGGQSYFYDLA